MSIPVNIQDVMFGSLYAITAYSIWADKKSVLPTEERHLKRRIIYNSILVGTCILAIAYGAFWHGFSNMKRADFLFGGNLMLQGVRALLQLRRERAAWNLSVVREIMES